MMKLEIFYKMRISKNENGYKYAISKCKLINYIVLKG